MKVMNETLYRIRTFFLYLLRLKKNVSRFFMERVCVYLELLCLKAVLEGFSLFVEQPR